jgi:hypothetical protein
MPHNKLTLRQAMKICHNWNEHTTITADGVDGFLACTNIKNSKNYCNSSTCPLLNPQEIKDRDIDIIQ